MSVRRFAFTLLILVTLATGRSLAQTTETGGPAPLPARSFPVELLVGPDDSAMQFHSRADIDDWVRDFKAWKEWAAQWRNRREPGWFTQSRQRRQRPDPPEWLTDECAAPAEERVHIAEACGLLVEWRSDAVAQATAAAAGAEDDEGNTTFWEHLHLDVGWPALQANNLIGVVGVHATTSVRGRLEIFIAPGAMLLNVPTVDGNRAWKVATNYGITYRLGQFRVFSGPRAVLHLNLAKAWLLDAGETVQTKSTDFIGFSMTFKKTRP